MPENKPFISILPDYYFGFIVMISDRKPWLRNDDGSWYFNANTFRIHLISEYKAYLKSFARNSEKRQEQPKNP